jgi:RNA polymerase sigma-70 factor (ECF subfamily)
MASRAAPGAASSGLGRDLAAGSPGALEECYRTLFPVVAGYLRRYVPADDVEDIVQMVFTEVWRSRERYDPDRSLEGWTLGIAHKRAVDHLRWRGRHPAVPLEDPHGPTAGRALPGEIDAGGDDELASRVSWSLEVGRALESLPPPQRRAIELAYFGDLTQREIADHLDVPIGTVKARMARGMRRLAELLGDRSRRPA